MKYEEPLITITLKEYNNIYTENIALKMSLTDISVVQIEDYGMLYRWRIKTNEDIIKKLCSTVEARDKIIADFKKKKKWWHL